jgi:hypothetical protein
MKRTIMSLMAVAIMSIASVGAFAQEKNLQERVTFRQEMWINNTSVEAGDYLVKYDAQTGEMTILDGKKVVATAKATIRTSEKSFTSDALLTSTTPAGAKLTGIRLGGQREEIMITDLTAELDKPISN